MQSGRVHQIGAARVAPEKLDRTSLPRRQSAAAPAEVQLDDQGLSGPNQAFRQHWEAFADELLQAFTLKNAGSSDHPRTIQQLRYVVALKAVVNLLRRVSQSDPAVNELAARFMELAEAIRDAAGGLSHPLLEPVQPRGPGSAKDLTFIWRTRAQVCIALEFLTDGNVEDAIGLAAKRYKKPLNKLVRRKADLKKSLGGWRKKFASEQVENELALKVYKHGIRMLEVQKASATAQELRTTGEGLLFQAAARADLLT